MKIKFKLYRYRNGLDVIHFKLKQQDRVFGLYWWIKHGWSGVDWPREWKTREEAIEHAQAIVDAEKKAIEDRKRWDLAAKVTLEIVEDIEL